MRQWAQGGGRAMLPASPEAPAWAMPVIVLAPLLRSVPLGPVALPVQAALAGLVTCAEPAMGRPALPEQACRASKGWTKAWAGWRGRT